MADLVEVKDFGISYVEVVGFPALLQIVLSVLNRLALYSVMFLHDLIQVYNHQWMCKQFWPADSVFFFHLQHPPYEILDWRADYWAVWKV